MEKPSSLLAKSMDFYYAQQAGTRTADGDAYDASSIVEGGDTTDGDTGSGGFFDAGDHVKFIKPQAQALYELAAGFESSPEGYGGSSDELFDQLLHGAKFLTSLLEGQANGEMIIQVGDGGKDHAAWGSAAEGDGTIFQGKMADYSEIAGLVAATLFKIAKIIKNNDVTVPSGYPSPEEMVSAGQEFLKGAEGDTDFSGSTKGTGPTAGFYDNYGTSHDEMLAAYVESYEATANEADYEKAVAMFKNNPDKLEVSGYAWDNVSARALMSLLKVAQEKGDPVAKDIQAKIEAFADDFSGKLNDGYTDLGQWGSNRYHANNAAIILDYGRFLKENDLDTEGKADKYYNAANSVYERLSQYVTGTDGGPNNPHHRRASMIDGDRSNGGGGDMIGGALVGGPSDGNRASYKDDVEDFVQNEVAIDYNAGWSSLLAGLSDPTWGDKRDQQDNTPIKPTDGTDDDNDGDVGNDDDNDGDGGITINGDDNNNDDNGSDDSGINFGDYNNTDDDGITINGGPYPYKPPTTVTPLPYYPGSGDMGSMLTDMMALYKEMTSLYSQYSSMMSLYGQMLGMGGTGGTGGSFFSGSNPYGPLPSTGGYNYNAMPAGPYYQGTGGGYGGSPYSSLMMPQIPPMPLGFSNTMPFYGNNMMSGYGGYGGTQSPYSNMMSPYSNIQSPYSNMMGGYGGMQSPYGGGYGSMPYTANNTMYRPTTTFGQPMF